MPKRRTPDECFFCGESPCVCNKRRPKQKVIKATPVVVHARVAQRKSITTNEDDEELNRALVVLAPLLHPDELSKYQGVIGTPVQRTDLTGRITKWKNQISSAQRRRDHPPTAPNEAQS